MTRMSEYSGAPDSDRWQTWQMDPLGSNEAPAHDPQISHRERLRKQAFAHKLEMQVLREKTVNEAQQVGHAQGVEQGYAQGLSEGRQAAALELQQQVLQTLQPLLELCVNFDQALKQMDAHIARQLTRIALEAAQQLAGEALTAQPEQVIAIVQKMLNSDPELTGKPRLWLNPDDLQLVHSSLGEQIEAAGWALHADTAILPGGCRVVSASGELDATRQSRLAMLSRSTERVLDDAVANLGEQP
ncbi:flagellar assembly protein FliH [Pseudomonas brassicacearum]|uniref:flagellar assembly protein FliH n=1 Tax=Pseudomonas brassicacearum TaxID=930166 RepID=UPI0007217097|nr:flagellar assembly protein FliH [Pseudomonas brassicacearum]ALQ01330.1 Flagellar assembly protein FliH [Pseudomonas brassicacearum]